MMAIERTMPTTAFVTGGTGFLGKRLVPILLGMGMTVRCLVRENSNLSSLPQCIPESDRQRLTFVRGELDDSVAMEGHLAGIDVVYHLAASLYGSADKMVEDTVGGTRGLLNAAAGANIQRVVLISSLGVYGIASLKPGETLDESVPIDPHPEWRDSYTLSKIRQEQVAWEIHERTQLPLVVIRPGVLYGPGRSLLSTRIGLRLGPILLQMGGDQRLPYCYVDNCAEAIALAGIAPDIEGQVFNVVDDDLPTGSDIFRTLRTNGNRVRSVRIPQWLIVPFSRAYAFGARVFGRQSSPLLTPYKSRSMWKPLHYSNARAKHSLNWCPKISSEEGIQRTIFGEQREFTSYVNNSVTNSLSASPDFSHAHPVCRHTVP